MPKPVLMLDCECYKNYFLIQFYNPSLGRLTYFELTDDIAPPTSHAEDQEKVRAILRKFRIVTFNGNNYDLPLVFLYLVSGTDCLRLKSASDEIIKTGLKWWHLERKFNYKVHTKRIDHVDLIEVAPGKASLKLYGGRLHSKRLQDLPIDPDQEILPEERQSLRDYCANDLRITFDLYTKLTPQLQLRESIGKEYDVNVMSSSDAQVAEKVIEKSVTRITKNDRIERKEVQGGTVLKYTPPAFIKFETDIMREVCDRMVNADYVVNDSGKIVEPKELKTPVKFGGAEYRTGIGGCHSSEEKQTYIANDTMKIYDRDAQSFYPAIIMNCGLYPQSVGALFQRIYQKLVSERLEAKKAGDKIKADSLKISINSAYGKMGNKYSFLYDPRLIIQTTLTGQLSLLMLIEKVTAASALVISANTDGITIACNDDRREELLNAVAEWEKQTGFITEETEYRAIYSRDVNNYIAIKTDGKIKSKGAYTPTSLSKNPTCEIATEAAIEFLKNGTPVAKTIANCKDVRKFLAVRSVTGGALYGDRYLGRVVRYYYKKDCRMTINYKINGNLVPRTTGACPLMELPDALPADIDTDWYVREACNIIDDVGAGLW